jgi:hypothetical protein
MMTALWMMVVNKSNSITSEEVADGSSLVTAYNALRVHEITRGHQVTVYCWPIL